MFEVLVAGILVSLVFGIVVDDEFYKLLNTVANLATVGLIYWHSQHVRRKIEPEVKDTAAVIKRTMGERETETEEYRGPERRKANQ